MGMAGAPRARGVLVQKATVGFGGLRLRSAPATCRAVPP